MKEIEDIVLSEDFQKFTNSKFHMFCSDSSTGDEIAL